MKEIVIGLGVYAALIIGWLWVIGSMFEYVLFSLSGKDVAFWADALIGCIITPLTFTAWAICFILMAAGLMAPFFG